LIKIEQYQKLAICQLGILLYLYVFLEEIKIFSKV